MFEKKHLENIREPQSLPDFVYDAIKEAIISGRIPTGKRLKQMDIAEQFNVSQQTVREALTRLVATGLVEQNPHRGFEVTHIPLEEQEEIYKLRVVLETFALEEGMNKLTAEDLDYMRRLIPKTASPDDSIPLDQVREANRDFHMLPVLATENKHLIRIMNQLWDITWAYYEFENEESRKISAGKELEEHAAILDALEQKDATALRKAVVFHITDSIEGLHEYMEHYLHKGQKGTAGETQKSIQNPVELEGIWRSQGYQWILSLSKTGYEIYDCSEISCILARQGPIVEFNELFHSFEMTNKDHFTAGLWGTMTRYTFQRQQYIPKTLLIESAVKKEDPVFNFEVFWRYFAENYAFFDLRKVNWDQVYQVYRPQITAATSAEELLEIFTRCIQFLNDLHVGMRVEGRYISGAKPHALRHHFQQKLGGKEQGDVYLDGLKDLSRQMIAELLNGTAKTAANNRVIWGEAAPGIGYLLVVTMSGFVRDEEDNSAENLAVLGAAMDQVMQDFRDKEGVIIDMRFNPGGEDAASLLIANRFADQKRLAFTKKARDGGGFTPEQKIYIYPEGAVQFTGPTVLLTSEATISAAEIFALAMLPLPHVTRIGERTHGVLSDVLAKRLPNGWDVGLSNEVYTACDGNLYENIGVPVHLNTPVFNSKDFSLDLSAAFDKAIAWVKAKI